VAWADRKGTRAHEPMRVRVAVRSLEIRSVADSHCAGRMALAEQQRRYSPTLCAIFEPGPAALRCVAPSMRSLILKLTRSWTLLQSRGVRRTAMRRAGPPGQALGSTLAAHQRAITPRVSIQRADGGARPGGREKKKAHVPPDGP
jgi:hypothetical protein